MRAPTRESTRKMMISITALVLAWWQSCFSAGLVRQLLVRGLLHGINTGMCHKTDLTDQLWKILDPQSQSPPGDVTAGVGPGRSGTQF